MEFLLEDEFLSHWKTTAMQQRCDQDDRRASRTHISSVARGSSNLKNYTVASHSMAPCVPPLDPVIVARRTRLFCCYNPGTINYDHLAALFSRTPPAAIVFDHSPLPYSTGSQSPIVQNTRVCHIIIFGQMFFGALFWSGVQRQTKHTKCSLLFDSGAKL